MKPGGDQKQVAEKLLTETGRGGLFRDGYLQDEPLVAYFEGNETPFFVFGSSKRGVTRKRGEATDRILPGSGYRSITAVTDTRVQFVVGGERDTGDWAEDVHLSNVESVSVESGLRREKLSITEADGTVWRVYLGGDVDAERIVTFLEDMSWIWIQVEKLLDETRKRLVDASQHEKSREYASAKDAISAAEKTLEEAGELPSDLPDDAGSEIRARIADVRRRYRETKRRIHFSQATHLVDEGEQDWRNDEFDRAYEKFVNAREQYREVLDIDRLDPDKVEVAHKRIERVEEKLRQLTRAPLRRANQDRELAVAADDPRERLEHLESAHRLYRRVIELDWGRSEKRFEGDPDVARDRVAETVDRILSTRRTIAARRAARARELIEEGNHGEARSAYADAMDVLETAVQLAREYDPGTVGELQDRLDELEARIREATMTVSESQTDNTESQFTGNDDGERAEDSVASRDGHKAKANAKYDDFDNWVTLAEKSREDDARGGDETADAPGDDLRPERE